MVVILLVVCFLQNSNLVLQADTRLIERRPRDEATGEVVSLVGKLQKVKMGDRYQRTKPSVESKSKKKGKGDSEKSLMKMKGHSLLSESVDQSMGIMYHPKTPETRETYELILAFISEMLGDQPRDVLCGAADEILQVMKSDKSKEKEKKKEIELLVGSLNNDKFAVLSGLCRKITDFTFDDNTGGFNTGDNLDDTYGVNVQFEESDEEEADGLMNEIREDDDEEDVEGEEAIIDSAIKASGTSGDTAGGNRRKEKESKIHPREIDAYWLQRKLSKYFDDPVVAQGKAAEVLKILKVARDDHEVETQLIVLLGFDLFEFIKILRHYRDMILYCTLLAQAQRQSDKNKIIEKMKSDPELAEILKKLESSQMDSTNGLDKDSAKESKAIEDEEMEDLFSDKAKILDLEDLSFQQGSHFMANKRCQLPEGSFRKQRKGCEIIHVPALKPKPFDPDEVSSLFNPL